MLNYQQNVRLMEHYHISWLDLDKLTKADISQARATWIAESEAMES